MTRVSPTLSRCRQFPPELGGSASHTLTAAPGILGGPGPGARSPALGRANVWLQAGASESGGPRPCSRRIPEYSRPCLFWESGVMDAGGEETPWAMVCRCGGGKTRNRRVSTWTGTRPGDAQAHTRTRAHTRAHTLTCCVAPRDVLPRLLFLTLRLLRGIGSILSLFSLSLQCLWMWCTLVLLSFMGV